MELESILNESIKIMEDEFYKKKFYFSYSSISKLMWNPQAFYQIYVLGHREERQEAHLVQGKIIHAMLLENEKFNDYFIISPTALPAGNQKVVIDRVFSHYVELKRNGDTRETLAEFSDAVLDVMKDMNYHQTLKTDQQRLDKILTPDSESYWNFLKSKGNKTLIDQQSYDFCQNAVNLVKTDEYVCGLLGCNTTEFDNKEVYNELPLQADISNKPYGIKGIVDNLVVDHDKKILYINDVKTTSKDLKDFSESVEFYSYWMQAVIYSSLVSVKYSTLISSGYKIVFHFVVIDKNFQCYPFPVREQTLVEWMNKLNQTLEKAEWHLVNKDYTLPYDFAVKSVFL
jgi:hypothetical protein